MLDRVIEAQIGDPMRISRIVRRISRIMALPALSLMLGGLMLFAISDRDGGTILPGPTSINLGAVLTSAAPGTRGTPAGNLAMSLGLFALVLVPAITVTVIFIEYARARRWRDASVALMVVGILALSVYLGKG